MDAATRPLLSDHISESYDGSTTDSGEVGTLEVGSIQHGQHRQPFPSGQVAALLLVQLQEPVCHSVIMPFVNQFVDETGVTGGNFSQVGYYAGIVVSTIFTDISA